jgi:virginiamycin B lyase
MRIAAGADDKLYVTDTGLNTLFRMDLQGNFEEFALPPSSQPHGITLGPDGNVWFALYGNDSIARITPDGTITEFPIPSGDGPFSITTGQDGNLWFTEQVGDRVGRAILNQVDGGGGPEVIFTVTSLPGSGRFARDITAGPDGDDHIWFTEQSGRIARIGMVSLFVEEFYSGSLASAPLGIASGPDGNVWFSEFSDLIGQTNLSGNVLAEHDVATAGCLPLAMIVGPDNMLWYTCKTLGMLGRTDPDDPTNPESFTLYVDSKPTGLVSGPGDAVWFVNEGLRSVGYMVPPL